jgi:arylsulfatase
MRMQHALAPNKPWLLYYATGTSHAPHHAPKDWIAKYKGQFDQGWDKVREETLARQVKLGVVPRDTKLTARPEQIPAWETLSADQKRLYARMMEVYAGALSHADHNIGRLLDAVEQSGQLDNTLVIFMMGDNGASAEGSLQGTTNEVGTAGKWGARKLGISSLHDRRIRWPADVQPLPGWLGARHGHADAMD